MNYLGPFLNGGLLGSETGSGGNRITETKVKKDSTLSKTENVNVKHIELPCV